jgi:hypothetical protein
MGVEMRKRRENGRFVPGPGLGAERVSVDVEHRVEGAKAEVTELANAPKPRYCRTFTRKRMAEALPEIVE